MLCNVRCHLVSLYKRNLLVALPATYKTLRGKEALGRVFLRVLRVTHVTLVSPMLQTPVSFFCRRWQRCYVRYFALFVTNLIIFIEESHPVVYRQLFITLVPSIHNVCKDQMYYYNWAISGDMFRPLTGHPQANRE